MAGDVPPAPPGPRPPVPCPVCGVPNPWPPVQPCGRCGCDLTSAVAARIFELDRQTIPLLMERQDLVARLQATSAFGPRPKAAPPGGPVARPPTAVTTPIQAQNLLGLAGVGLLGLAAIVFTAVTWRTLSPTVRVLVLVAATGVAAGAARAIGRRGLASTGGALGVLAAVLAAVTVVAAHRLDVGGFGSAHPASAGVLASVAAVAVASALSGRLAGRPVQDVAVLWSDRIARAAWGFTVSFALVRVVDLHSEEEWQVLAPVALLAAAAVLAGRWVLGRGVALDVFAIGWLVVASIVGPLAVSEAEPALAVLSGAAALAAAAAWLWLGAGTKLAAESVFPAIATLTGLVVGTSARLVPDDQPFVAYAAVVSVAVVSLLLIVASPERLVPRAKDERPPRPDTVRWIVLTGTWPATVPTLVIAAIGAVAAAGALADRSLQPWHEVGDPAVESFGSDMGLTVAAAVVVIGAATVAAWPTRPGRATTATLALLTVLTPAALWHADVRKEALFVAAVVPAAAIFVVLSPPLRARLSDGEQALLGVLAPLAVLLAVGWMAETPTGTLLGGAVALATAVGARALPPSDETSGPALAEGARWLLLAAATGSAAIVAASAAELLDGSPIVTAVATALAGAGAAWLVRPARTPPVLWVGVLVAVHAAVVVIALIADEPEAAAAAALVGTGSLAIASGVSKGPAAVLASWSAVAHASAANAIVLADRGVDVVEAYTLVPAALMLGLGATRLRREPAASSIETLLPGLVLALAPSSLMLLADPSHLPRTLALAVGGAVALGGGVPARLSAPTWAGASAIAVVVVTQVWVAASVLPRWTVFATLGLVLVVLSATYERRLADVRRLRGRVATFR